MGSRIQLRPDQVIELSPVRSAPPVLLGQLVEVQKPVCILGGRCIELASVLHLCPSELRRPGKNLQLRLENTNRPSFPKSTTLPPHISSKCTWPFHIALQTPVPQSMVPSQLNHFIGKTAKLAVRAGSLSGKGRARRSMDRRRMNTGWKGEGGGMAIKGVG